MVAASCPVNQHTITDMPYLSEQVKLCQYAGTIDVDSTANSSNLFYWFFRNDNDSAPLILWINGGPGSSSMFGLFAENGPLYFEEVEGGEGQFSQRNESWADDYHLVYLDQPVGTGFSYGSEIHSDINVIANDFTTFLAKFL